MGWFRGKEVLLRDPNVSLIYYVGEKKALDQVSVDFLDSTSMCMSKAAALRLSKALSSLAHWSNTAAGDKSIRKTRAKFKTLKVPK